eukprot:SAG31_NODE_22559_length_523_cov_0.610849_2_plen_27_part_01
MPFDISDYFAHLMEHDLVSFLYVLQID